ncbi:MAG: lasso RiPP family leader peptide-containing protein [Dehalococcoidia bacterium]|nr:lasso RiPP family leader peptide-containing protein [Dehalococcoidia bacterium]
MKKQYQAPRLSEHGDIRSLTLGSFALEFSEGLFEKKPRPTGSA